MGKKSAEVGALVSSHQVRGPRCPSDIPGEGQGLTWSGGACPLPVSCRMSTPGRQCRAQPVLSCVGFSSVSHAWFCEPLQVLVSPRRPVPQPWPPLHVGQQWGDGVPTEWALREDGCHCPGAPGPHGCDTRDRYALQAAGRPVVPSKDQEGACPKPPTDGLGAGGPVLSLPRPSRALPFWSGLPEAFSVSPAVRNSVPCPLAHWHCVCPQGASRGEQWRRRGHSLVRGPALQLETEELPSN